MITLKSLKLKDFYSHENTTIDFKDNVKLLLDGESGAGKSTILESIIFALYGESRTDSKSIVRSGCKKATVTLELSDLSGHPGKPENITIERSMTSTGKHTVEVLFDGVASPIIGVKELQGYINKELIGASYLLFVNSVAYMQGNSESFVAQTAAKRKDLLLEIVKAENYDEYYEKAKDALSTTTLQKTALEMQVLSLKAEIAVAERQIDGEGDLNVMLIATQRAISFLEEKKDSLLKLIAKFEESDKNIKLCEDRVAGAERDADRAKTALESLRTQLKDLDVITFVQEDYDACRAKIDAKMVVLEGLDAMLRSQAAKEKEKLEYIQTKPHIMDWSSSIAQLEEANKKLSARKWCPSGTACPHQLPTIAEIESNKTKIVEMNQKMVIDAILLEEWNKGLKSFDQIVDTEKLFNKVKEEREEMSELTVRLAVMENVRTKIESLSAQISLIPVLEKDLFDKTVFRDVTIGELAVMNEQRASGDTSKQKSELSTVTSELALKRGEESSINSDLILIKKNKEELVEKKATLKEIEDTLLPELVRNFNDVSLVKDAFGSKGVKAVMIDYILPKLEDKINSVLSQLSDFTVRLDTQQLKADGEGNKEGLFITVTSPAGTELPFESLSGGEKVKITVAISEALASLQKVGFRLFDEFVTALDDDSLENFMVTIEHLQAQYPQMLLVSHIQSVKDMFEEKITVIKKNGVSLTS